ncbi:hypothetical protein AJ88_30470 [Mesorhizobium amorphae CCBAU 01583]|nr:hypothetical protein AJ88_30470 [Mesorhizobium amorphae CCBAU 01583]
MGLVQLRQLLVDRRAAVGLPAYSCNSTLGNSAASRCSMASSFSRSSTSVTMMRTLVPKAAWWRISRSMTRPEKSALNSSDDR